ncbi:hypothetical protein DFP72DRAFT_882738 [Ephemerocybe angulata]|uniref:Yeast cell wall synthesis Kre9/Knh1-like N-terminal domain-containing protein n=1 Tax=Ephemerocybe angulata TaxID=980116 RepID=A0A8H6IAK2_9AGAR|nr:hypothetical protein DFP72DRAFT_882738 [Tulosesus angulatus]
MYPWIYLLFFRALTSVSARLSPTRPAENTLHASGSSLSITWVDDTHRPSLNDTGLVQIDLYAGNTTFVVTLATNVDPKSLGLAVTIPVDLPFNIADYTLRFITRTPAMTVYSAGFLIVSASGHSIVMESNDSPSLPSDPIPRTITVTKTSVATPTVQRVISLTTVTLTSVPSFPTSGVSLVPLPPDLEPALESTFVEITDSSITLAPHSLIAQGLTTDFTTVRAYPVFISRFASSSPAPTLSTAYFDAPNANTTTGSTSTSGSTPIMSTSVAKPSSLKDTKSSGQRTICSPFTYTMLLLFLVIIYM